MVQILTGQVDRLPTDAGPHDLTELLEQAAAAGEPAGSLRGAVHLCLESDGPALLLWGEDRRFIYNQAYLDFGLSRNPGRFGTPLRETWVSAWNVVHEQLERVFATGQAQWIPDRAGVTARDGVEREVFYTCHLTPVLGDDGVVGVHVSILDTTAAVLLQRRLELLRRLAVDGLELGSGEELNQRLAETLADAPDDIPFALVYEFAQREQLGRLRVATGVPEGAVPQEISIRDTHPWPVAAALAQTLPTFVDDVEDRVPGLRVGRQQEESRRAFVSFVDLGERMPSALYVLGVSNRLSLDTEYQAFLFDVLRQLGSDLGVVASAGRDREQVANLRRAMESNRQIGAAIGILMMSHKLTEEQAFNTLSAVSQRSNRKLRDVADEVVRTGSLGAKVART